MNPTMAQILRGYDPMLLQQQLAAPAQQAQSMAQALPQGIPPQGIPGAQSGTAPNVMDYYRQLGIDPSQAYGVRP